MSIEPTPDWSPDPDVASLLKQEREDAASSGADTTLRIWHRLEMHAVGAAATGALTASIATGAGVVDSADVASGAAGAASAGGSVTAKALAWKIGAASMFLLAGGAIGASVQARLSPPAPTSHVATAAVERGPAAAAAEATPSLAPAQGAASTVATVDVESLPRAPAPSPVAVARSTASPSSANASSSNGTAASGPPGSPSASTSSIATSLGEEQRLLDTARAAVARGAYSSALGSLTEHQTRFPSGRLTEERELLFVQALAGAGAADAARARGRAFAERFPGSIFLPAVRAVSASQER